MDTINQEVLQPEAHVIGKEFVELAGNDEGEVCYVQDPDLFEGTVIDEVTVDTVH